MPAPAVPGQKMVTMETKIPETWMPGQKLVWVSPIGQKVALAVPETAKPGETLEFQVPASIVSGGPQPPPAENVPAPAVPLADRDGEQATLEVVIPADWKDGVKLATTLESGQRVIITPPDGSKPGMTLEFNVPASKLQRPPSSPQAAAPPQPAPAAPPAAPVPEEPPRPREQEASPARPAAVEERGTEQGAAQPVASTVKLPQAYSKSALLEIYAQKTEAPWVKRASSRKYSMEAVRSKVPVLVSSTSTGSDHAAVAQREVLRERALRV